MPEDMNTAAEAPVQGTPAGGATPPAGGAGGTAGAPAGVSAAPAADPAPGAPVVPPTEQQQEAARDIAAANTAGTWLEALPEAWRGVEGLDKLGSLDEALSALQRGMAWQPATAIEQLVTTPPAGIQIDEGLNKAFRELGVKIGLTQAQAQELVNFEAQQMQAMEEQAAAQATEELRQRWGVNFDANSARAAETLLRLDARMGNRLSAALGEGGLKNAPVLVEAFSLIGSLLSEDSLGGGSMGGDGQIQPETAESMFRSLFAGGR